MKRVLIDIICILFMILFIYTGISKLMEFSVFEEQLRESIFKPIAPLVAWMLPISEILVAFLLLVQNWRLKGLYLSFFLMAAFTIYVIGLVSFSSQLPCSCGGILQELSWPGHIVFNCIFLGLSVCGISLYKHSNQVHSQQSSSVINV